MVRMVRPIAALVLFVGLLAGGTLLYAQWVPQQQPLSVQMAQTTGSFADPAFQQVWERTDKPVADGVVTDRSWTWGPEGFFVAAEPYVEAANGQHLVQYFDKSRMEINDPQGDRSSQWFVTNGLLVIEMMSGQIARGNTVFTQTVPAQIPVAGDASASINAPTYASLAKVASLEGNNRAQERTGQTVDQALDKDANVLSSAQIKEYAGTVEYSVYEPTLGHNIPNVFWTFMNQSGLVYVNGQLVTDKIVDWVFAFGYPITEPYWIQVSVGGADRWVLMQAFQRRILTYSPQNDPSFQVEMGNVGRSYYDWRYSQQGQTLPSATVVVPTATGTVTPAPTTVASIAVDPEAGSINTTLKVTGHGFPPSTGITVGVQVPGSSEQRGLTSAVADGAGNFTSYISLPDELAREGNVTVYASANAGSVVATAEYVINHNPAINLRPPETTNVGVIEITGSDFPARSEITLLARNASNGDVIGSSRVTADDNGAFDVTYTLQGRAAVGSQYTIYAQGPNDIEVQAPVNLRIVQQPLASVQPNRGPVGVNVIFSGSRWQPNRLLQITLEGENGQTLLPLPPVVTDGAGNFATQVLISSDYSAQSQVTLWATDNTSAITVRAPYVIDRTVVAPTPIPIIPTAPPPVVPSPTRAVIATPTSALVPTTPPLATGTVTAAAAITVTPNPATIGEPVTVAGLGFTAGSSVTISLVTGTVVPPTPAAGSNTPFGTPVATASANAQGVFAAQFTLDPTWQNAGTVTVLARAADGTLATAQLSIAGPRAVAEQRMYVRRSGK